MAVPRIPGRALLAPRKTVPVPQIPTPARISRGTSGYALIGNGANAPSYQGFLQAGAGAVARTWNDKLRDGVTVKDFGASGSSASTTGTISASSNALSLAAASDFANGQGIRVNHAGAAFTLNQATSLTATPQGTAGATTYQYKVSSLDGSGGVGAATSSFQTTTGNATLSALNYNHLAWTAATGTPPAGYAVYKNIAGTFTLIGVVVGTTFDDTGLTSYAFLDWVPSTAPAAALADWLVTTISSGGGTTTLTLAATATTSVSGGTVTHDDAAAVQAAFNASLLVVIPPGTYLFATGINLNDRQTVAGSMGGSIVENVSINHAVFSLASHVQVRGLTVLLNAGNNAFNGSSIAYSVFADIWCKGAQNSATEWTYCFNIVDGAYINISNIILSSISGNVAPPAMNFAGTGLNPSNSTSISVSHVQGLNDGAAALAGNWITFNNVYSGEFSHSLLNAFGQTQGARATGVMVGGGLQILKMDTDQFINFGVSIDMDQIGGNYPLGLTVINGHFDWCVSAAIKLNGGGSAILQNNTLYGEGLNGNIGVYLSSVFGGVNVISGNTFIGFNGSGSVPLALNSNNNTTITGNGLLTCNAPSGSCGGAACVVDNNSGWISGWTTLSRATDLSRASSATPTADPVLQFAMAANANYRVRFTLFFTGGAGGAAFSVSGPASPTSLMGYGFYDTGGGFANLHAVTSYIGTTGLIGGAGLVVVHYELEVHNGANAGTFSVNWAQNSSNAANTTLNAGSHLEYSQS